MIRSVSQRFQRFSFTSFSLAPRPAGEPGFSPRNRFRRLTGIRNRPAAQADNGKRTAVPQHEQSGLFLSRALEGKLIMSSFLCFFRSFVPERSLTKPITDFVLALARDISIYVCVSTNCAAGLDLKLCNWFGGTTVQLDWS